MPLDNYSYDFPLPEDTSKIVRLRTNWLQMKDIPLDSLPNLKYLCLRNIHPLSHQSVDIRLRNLHFSKVGTDLRIMRAPCVENLSFYKARCQLFKGNDPPTSYLRVESLSMKKGVLNLESGISFPSLHSIILDKSAFDPTDLAAGANPRNLTLRETRSIEGRYPLKHSILYLYEMTNLKSLQIEDCPRNRKQDHIIDPLNRLFNILSEGFAVARVYYPTTGKYLLQRVEVSSNRRAGLRYLLNTKMTQVIFKCCRAVNVPYLDAVPPTHLNMSVWVQKFEQISPKAFEYIKRALVDPRLHPIYLCTNYEMVATFMRTKGPHNFFDHFRTNCQDLVRRGSTDPVAFWYYILKCYDPELFNPQLTKLYVMRSLLLTMLAKTWYLPPEICMAIRYFL